MADYFTPSDDQLNRIVQNITRDGFLVTPTLAAAIRDGVIKGLRRPTIDELEFGHYVVSTNIRQDGSVSRAAIILTKHPDGSWNTTSRADTYSDPDVLRKRIEDWQEDYGLTRVHLEASV